MHSHLRIQYGEKDEHSPQRTAQSFPLDKTRNEIMIQK